LHRSLRTLTEINGKKLLTANIYHFFASNESMLKTVTGLNDINMCGEQNTSNFVKKNIAKVDANSSDESTMSHENIDPKIGGYLNDSDKKIIYLTFKYIKEDLNNVGVVAFMK
jgi:hypothetical protein